MTMEKLNYDCLYNIFQQLPTKAQVNVALSSPHFEQIILDIWRRKQFCRNLRLWQLRKLLANDYHDMCYVLTKMRESIKAFDLKDEIIEDYLRELKSFKITETPLYNVESFQLTIERSWNNLRYPRDEDMLTLHNLCPNLKSFRITIPLTGCYLEKFTKLENLELYEEESKEYELHPIYLQNICERLANLRVLDIRSYELSTLELTPSILCLKKLEVLKLNLSTFRPVINEVIRSLPKLRILKVLVDFVIDITHVGSIDSYNYKIKDIKEVYQIIKERYRSIVGLAVDNYYLPCNPGWDENLAIFRMKKLQTFAFASCDYTRAYDAEDMLEKYTEMSQLKILSLRHWQSLSNRLILKFIELCTNLEHLDISFYRGQEAYRKPILMDILNILKRRVDYKRKVLTIYYLKSFVEEEVESNPEFWSKNDYIKFSKDFPPGSDSGLSYIERGFQFEFDDADRLKRV